MTPRYAAALAFACLNAWARTPAGPLGALELPNNTRPAIVAAGAAINVAAADEGALRLVGTTGEYPLQPEWKPTSQGTAHADVQIPADVPPGTYALDWSKADESDRNERAVYVQPPDTEAEKSSRQYNFACVRLAPDASTQPDTIRTLGPDQAQFVVAFLTGNETGYPADLATLDACPLPTFVVADAPAAIGEQWFGPGNFIIRFGPDAYIAPVTGRAGLGDSLGPVTGELQRLRQSMKTARWAVGLFAAAGAPSMRNEITLFVDNPLHVCIYGAPRANAPSTTVAWAGWYGPPKVFAAASGQAAIFTANRAGIAIQKAPAPTPAPEPPVSSPPAKAPKRKRK